MKKGLLIAAVLLLICGTVFANGTKEEAPKSEVVVSMWTGVPTAQLNKMKGSFTGSSEIMLDEVGYGSLKQKQLLSFQAEKGTKGNLDVVYVNGPWMSEYVEAGYLMNIEELAKEVGLDLSIYDKALMENLTYDGKVYGVPTFLQTIIGAYDSAVFEEKGLKVPTNYDELVEVAAALKADGTGVAMPASQANGSYTVWSQLLYSDHGYIENDGKLNMLDTKVVEAVNRYKTLTDLSADGSLGWAHEGVIKALQSKAAPMGLVMSGSASNLHDKNTSMIADSVKYFPFYGKDDNAAANQAYWVWAIPANCEDPKAALEFIAWVAGYDYEKQSTLDCYTISGITALAEDTEVTSNVPFAATVMEAFANGKADPINGVFDKLKGKMNAVLSEVASTDKADVEKLLQNVQDEFGAQW